MNKSIFLLTLFTTCFIQAQIIFEPGYFIDNNNNRKEVMIKNIEWLDNPTSFVVMNENSGEETRTIENVKEFGLINGPIYIRKIVNLDKSTSNINALGYSRKPDFHEEQLFLKKVLSGKASLYFFSGFGVKRYFYSKDNGQVKPLVYKKYLVEGPKIATNEMYKLELKNELSCATIDESDYSKLQYKLESLVNFFEVYNTCEGSKSIMHNLVSKKDKSESKIHMRLNAGIRSNDLSALVDNELVEFPSNISFQFGVEGEFVFNFNRNKWSLLAGLTYFSYNEEASFGTNNSQLLTIDYSAVELSVGGRHSFFINDNSRIFLSGYYIVPFNLNQELMSSSSVFDDEDDFTNTPSFGVGLGFEYSKFSGEVRIISSRSLLNFVNSKTDYSSISLTLGYSLL